MRAYIHILVLPVTLPNEECLLPRYSGLLPTASMVITWQKLGKNTFIG